MNSQARYVVTINDNDVHQTFVFDGATTIDDVFSHVAQRSRGGSFGTIANKLSGKYKIFDLTISRDESNEPTTVDSFDQEVASSRP